MPLTLTIETANASEMREEIAKLFAASFGAIPMQVNVEMDVDQPDAGATQDAEPGERQARFKRTKSEIERGLSVEQAKAERAASTGAKPESTGSTTTADADPFSESASQSTSAASPGSLTTSDVRKAMGDFLNRDGNDAAKIKDILHQFKTDTGAIVEAASGLQSGDYAAFIERLAA